MAEVRVIDTPPLLHTFNGFDLLLCIALYILGRWALNAPRRR